MAEESERKKRQTKTALLKERIEEMTAELEDYRDRHLRALADLDNFKKRMLREREQYTTYANANLIGSLLSVLDNFERALDSGKDLEDVEPFYRGVAMIYEELKSVLEKEGLEQVIALGEEFNPERHEAVVAVESGSHPPNVVVEELQKGYILKDRVIRPSKVAVSKSRSKEVEHNGESNRD